MRLSRLSLSERLQVGVLITIDPRIVACTSKITNTLFGVFAIERQWKNHYPYVRAGDCKSWIMEYSMSLRKGRERITNAVWHHMKYRRLAYIFLFIFHGLPHHSLKSSTCHLFQHL